MLSQHGFSIENVIDLFTVKPSQVMGIDLDAIEKNKPANFVVIDPNAEWTFENKNISSMSKNSALINRQMKGKVILVACKNKIHNI